MNLSKIRTDPDHYQFRDTPFAETTVNAIVEEGIDPARFDPIPVIMSKGFGTVAGDGHSRLEAVKRLAELDRLPSKWKRPRGWNIPTRSVREDDALRLAYVANMTRAPFTAVEEAKIFQARLTRESIQEIAKSSHVTSGYVLRRLRLNKLCRTIREAVGQSWGLDVDKACVLAEMVERYSIDDQTQQSLWLKVLSKGDWTTRSLSLFMKRIGQRLSAATPDTTTLLFALGPNVERAVEEITCLAQDRRRARRGVQSLIQAVNSLDDFPDLQTIIRENGQQILDRMKELEQEDADAVNALL